MTRKTAPSPSAEHPREEGEGVTDGFPRGAPIPPLFSVSGLIDLGAQVTAVQDSILTGMGIPSIGSMAASSSVLGGEGRSLPIIRSG